MIAVLALAAVAMPLPPPPQMALGFGHIPDQRNAPILSWIEKDVSAVDWNCNIGIQEGEKFTISGRFRAFKIVPSDKFGNTWPPYTWADVRDGSSHGFSGLFLTTYSGSFYGYRFAVSGKAYEIAIKLGKTGNDGTIELLRFDPAIDSDWTHLGAGTCDLKSPIANSEPKS